MNGFKKGRIGSGHLLACVMPPLPKPSPIPPSLPPSRNLPMATPMAIRLWTSTNPWKKDPKKTKEDSKKIFKLFEYDFIPQKTLYIL